MGVSLKVATGISSQAALGDYVYPPHSLSLPDHSLATAGALDEVPPK